MTSDELADTWVPVPIRFRHVLPGDMFVGRDGELWRVDRTGPGMAMTASTSINTFTSDVDPDDVIPVLVPTPERDAVELTREQLGARLIERRTAPPT